MFKNQNSINVYKRIFEWFNTYGIFYEAYWSSKLIWKHWMKVWIIKITSIFQTIKKSLPIPQAFCTCKRTFTRQWNNSKSIRLPLYKYINTILKCLFIYTIEIQFMTIFQTWHVWYNVNQVQQVLLLLMLWFNLLRRVELAYIIWSSY